MKIIKFALVAMVLLAAGCKSRAPLFNVNDGLLVENVTIISGRDSLKIDRYVGYVLLDDSLIRYAGRQEPRVEGKLKKINGQGKYIIPGLIDSHVHLANVAGMTYRIQRDKPELVKSYFEQLPKSYLYYGYTTLVDVNNYAPRIVAKLKNATVGPEIFTCGSQIQVMNDFMMEMEEVPLEERLQFSFLYDKYNEAIKLPDSIDLNLHSPKAILSTIVKEHGIGAKIVYEDEATGFPQSWELPSLNLMRDVVAEAKDQKIPVILHATSYDGQKFGLEAGISIFAHPMWNWQRSHEQFLDTAFTQDHQRVLEEICTRQIGNQLTFRAIMGEVDLMDNRFMADPALVDVYPKNYLTWLQSDEANWGKAKILNRAKIVQAINPVLYNFLRPKFESDEAMFRGIQQVLKVRMKVVAKYLSDHNANLLFGTDGVAMNMATNPPGYNGFLEMQHWIDAGVSLEKLFMATTYNNARAFNLSSKYGSIESGKTANLLLLNQDPLQSVRAYDQISSVILQGKEYQRDSLSARKAE